MHEFSLASDILDAALAAAGGERVVRVLVVVGPDTHADHAILSDAFEIAATGTAAEGAGLELAPATSRGVAVTAVDVAQ